MSNTTPYIIKKGPFGSHGGFVKDMNPTDITRIVKITIHHSKVIDALIVYFERNGTTECTDRWGGEGGTVTEIDLKTNEYITSVKGNFCDDYNGHEVVMSLVLETNLGIYGPYGTENGEIFELNAIEGQIIGFHARYGRYVNAIGVYVQPTGPIMKKGPLGGDGGIAKDMDPTDITRIVKITINHSIVIDALTVYFECNGSPQCTDRWGGDGGTMTEIEFKTIEYVMYVKGYINDNYDGQKVVMGLTLETNLAFYGPYGTEEGELFEFSSSEGKIIGFHARYGMYLNAVGVYVQSIAPIIKKESFGSTGLSVKDMDPTNIARIVKIEIHHSEVIDALIFYFECNGMTECTDQWGGDGGEVAEIHLKENEYITYVKGYFNDDYNGHEVVMSLELKTNLAVYGPYGTENGESFEISAFTGEIIGFHARHGKYVNAVGAYVQTRAPIMKKGPVGSSGELVKDMDPRHITRIVKIAIRHSYVIDALTVFFEHNGTTECTDQWGGHGGNVTEIDLKPYEYIMSVKGSIDNFYDDPTVSSLVLETNLAVYGPYGTEKGESFELSTPDSQIIGFHARHGKYVNAIGVYVQKSEYGIIKKDLFGGTYGTVKDMDLEDITRIVKIIIRHGKVIDALLLHFERNGNPECTDQWGGDGGSMSEINFKTNEYITHVEGYSYYHSYYNRVVASLTLKTNLAVYGPYGLWERGERFEFHVPGGQIIGFHGRASNYLHAVGVYVKVLKKKSVLCGGSGGLPKDMDITGITRLVNVSICYSNAIHSFSICFDRNGTIEQTSHWGGKEGELVEIDLKPNEYIISVRGYAGYLGDELFIVRSLQLITNLNPKGYGPYGKEKGTPFELSYRGSPIIGFHGRSGEYLDAIGVYTLG